MEEIYKKVLESIYNHIKAQESSAYFEIVCTEVFEEFNEENEIKLNKILKELEKENRIIVNGDRIAIRPSDFLIPDYFENETKKLNDIGLDCVSKETDIGHGCNIPFLGIELCEVLTGAINTGIFALAVGTIVSDIRESIDGLKFIKNKIKEVLGNNFGDVFYSENILQLEVVDKILEEYKDIKITNLKLVNKVKITASCKGMYSVQNYAFPTESLEGSPEYIEYFVFEVWSEDFNHDYDLVRCEILSNSKIISFKQNQMIIGGGLSPLE